MAGPVVWQNEDHTITLIDIPRSIAAAQGTLERPCHDEIVSTEAITTPYAINEPKSEKAWQALAGQAVDAELHAEYNELLCEALRQVRTQYSGPWHLPRYIAGMSRETAKKRKLYELDGSTVASHDPAFDAVTTVSGLIRSPDDVLATMAKTGLTSFDGLPIADDSKHVSIDSDSDEAHRRLAIRCTNESPSDEFRIPPRSFFYLGDCANLHNFHATIRAQAEHLDIRRRFDFTLLDPPWPNRSVKRTHKTADSTYAIAGSLTGVYDLIVGMDLDMLMESDCLVGVWITNKAQVRDLVLGEGGIFDCWGVELIEEWIWLKTTAAGVPVTPIDAMWRKPYEVLLLGRRCSTYAAAASTPTARKAIRRVILGVPDLHSRKPCLKDLIEPLMSDVTNYRALKVFARHLVAGWWSVGDQCIKYNWDGYWRSPRLTAKDREHSPTVT